MALEDARTVLPAAVSRCIMAPARARAERILASSRGPPHRAAWRSISSAASAPRRPPPRRRGALKAPWTVRTLPSEAQARREAQRRPGAFREAVCVDEPRLVLQSVRCTTSSLTRADRDKTPYGNAVDREHLESRGSARNPRKALSSAGSASVAGPLAVPVVGRRRSLRGVQGATRSRRLTAMT